MVAELIYILGLESNQKHYEDCHFKSTMKEESVLLWKNADTLPYGKDNVSMLKHCASILL